MSDNPSDNSENSIKLLGIPRESEAARLSILRYGKCVESNCDQRPKPMCTAKHEQWFEARYATDSALCIESGSSNGKHENHKSRQSTWDTPSDLVRVLSGHGSANALLLHHTHTGAGNKLMPLRLDILRVQMPASPIPCSVVIPASSYQASDTFPNFCTRYGEIVSQRAFPQGASRHSLDLRQK